MWPLLITRTRARSVVSRLASEEGNMRGPDGKFEFKLVWPKSSTYQQWKQTSNPLNNDGGNTPNPSVTG